MGDPRTSLNPSLLSRLSQWLRPDWSRTLLARRVVAAALVLLAAVAAVRPDPDSEPVPVVVAAHDLGPGAALTASDVQLETRSAALIPDGSRTAIGEVVGSTLAGPARRGEVLTDVRLLGRRLAESAAGPDARIVPLHPADGALIDLVRAGDVVDVIAAGQGGTLTAPRVVASDAIVVSVSAPPKAGGSNGERAILVAVPATVATAVASAALVATLTLTLH